MGDFLRPTLNKVYIVHTKNGTQISVTHTRTESTTTTEVAVIDDNNSNWDNWYEDNDDELDDDKLRNEAYIVNWLATRYDWDDQIGWMKMEVTVEEKRKTIMLHLHRLLYKNFPNLSTL